MPLNYNSLTFDELLRALRDDPNPVIRMLVARTDLEIENISAEYLANIQEVELHRDGLLEKLDEAKDVLSGA